MPGIVSKHSESYEVDTMTIPILQRRKLRPSVDKYLAYLYHNQIVKLVFEPMLFTTSCIIPFRCQLT